MSEKISQSQQFCSSTDLPAAFLPPPGIRVDFSVDRLRILANVIRKRNDFSTEQVHAFLSLYREELEAHINAGIRDFIEKKLG